MASSPRFILLAVLAIADAQRMSDAALLKRIQQIKATLEELFDIEVMHHSLNVYARKKPEQ